MAALIVAAGIAAATALRANKPGTTAEMKASIPSLEFIDPSSLPQGMKVEAGTKLAPGSYRAFMTGERILTVQWVQNANNSDEIDLRLTLDAEGTRRFKQQTSQNVNKLIPLAVDGKIIEAIFVGQPVLDGLLVISGAQMEGLRAILDPKIVVASHKPSPATAATEPEEGAQDLGSLGSTHATNATAQNGLLVWVPKDWSIVVDNSGYFVMAPKKYEWVSVLNSSVGLSVVLNPPFETPSEYYDSVKALLGGGTTVSGPQDVSWLGATGLTWTHLSADKHAEIMLARLDGEDGFRVELWFSAKTSLFDEYRSTADSVFASIKRAE